MPYDFEYASYSAVQRIAQSSHVHTTLARLHVALHHTTLLLPAMVTLNELAPVAFTPQRVLVIDGSWCETPLVPTADALVGYISVAAVMLDLAQLRHISTQRPINPQLLGSLTTTTAIEAVIPGTNIHLDQMTRPMDGLRRCIYDTLSAIRCDPAGESLLTTYEALLAYKPVRVQPQRCPYADDGCDHQHGTYRHATGMYPCACPQQRDLYSTDALRLYEDLPRFGSNAAMLTQLMRIMEHLWLIHYLRMLEQHEDWATLATTTFVLDGPLAIFGSAGWLSHSIRCELRRLNQRVQQAINDPAWHVHLVGIEKTGQFVDYFALIDQRGSISPQTVGLLSDAFIKQAILGRNSSERYGHNNYYGQKFLYKTAQQTRIVCSLASDDLSVPLETNHQPLIHTTALLLDEVYSAHYPNAILPLMYAHQAAALPTHISTMIFRYLTNP